MQKRDAFAFIMDCTGKPLLGFRKVKIVKTKLQVFSTIGFSCNQIYVDETANADGWCFLKNNGILVIAIMMIVREIIMEKYDIPLWSE